MNDQNLDSVNELPIGDPPVVPPPVEDVRARGSRHLLLRRGWQVMATAALVTAFSAGGLALRPAPAAESVTAAAGSSTHALPGQPPDVAQLLGTWRWLGADRAGGSSTPEDPSFVTFAHQSRAFHLNPIVATPLYWTGDGGCLDGWRAALGAVHLRADGHFSTSRDFLSYSCDPTGSGGSGTTLSEVLRQTRWLRLVGGELRFYDVHRHLVGTFGKS